MIAVLLSSLFLSATTTTAVVVTKRSGVSQPIAQLRAEAVRAALGAEYAEVPLEDLTSCNGKRPCLVKEARDRGWSAMVSVETATVISDALISVVLISIDDDGREVIRVSKQVPEGQLATELEGAIVAVKAELLKLAPPLSASAPVVAKTVPVIEPVAVTPPQAPRVSQGEPRPATRWIPLAVGAGALLAGVVLKVVSESAAARLRTETFATPNDAVTLGLQGQVLQSAGLSLIVGGGVVTLGGLALALLWPEQKLSPVVIFSREAGVFGVAGVFQ